MTDNLKDNAPQKDTSTSPILYNPELFKNDPEIYVIYRKIENITAAVHLVTGLIPELEALKTAIRQQSLDCFFAASALIGKSTHEVSDFQKISQYLLSLHSLLNITLWTGLISQMNVSVLQKEITETSSMLANLIKKDKSRFFLNDAFFKTEEIPKGHYSSGDSYRTDVLNKGQFIKDNIKDIKKTEKSKALQSTPPSVAKNERREVILNLLSKKNNLTIKDFSAVLTSYSEKTIQRELLALVQEKVLKKEGERRWSTYSLA